jgi:hypothetical protein
MIDSHAVPPRPFGPSLCSRAPWVEIHDSLRQEAGGVPFGERD